MRSALTAVIAGLLTLCAGACGHTVKDVAPAVLVPLGPPAVHGYIKGDEDEDGDEVHVRDADDALIRDYGDPAGVTDTQEVTALLKRYYASAAAGNSAMVCALTFSGLAKSPHLIDAVAEDYEPVPGSPPLHGKRCVTVVSILTKQRHQELVEDTDTLVAVLGMRVRGAHGLAILGFGTIGERMIPLQREHGTWKVDWLFDKAIT